MATFADRLKQELAARPNIKQADIARAAGVSSQAVSGWLSGKYIVSEEKARKVASFLGCSWIWLMHGEQSEASEAGRYQTLPPAIREWLDRQARMVHEFEEQHPLLAAMMFEQVDADHIVGLRELIEALEVKSRSATISGSLVIERGGKTLAIDRIAFDIFQKLSDKEDHHLWPLTIEMIRGRSIYKLLPTRASRDLHDINDQVLESKKEVGRVLNYGETVITATAFPFNDSAIVITIVDISNEIEIGQE